MKKKQKIIYIILLSLFIILTISVKMGITQNIDNYIANNAKAIQNDVITKMLIIFTNMGGIAGLFFITMLTAIILFILKKPKYALIVITNVMISTCTYIIVKNIIQRPRPYQFEPLIMENGFSFPSGHSVNNMAFYGLAVYLVYKNVKNKKLRNFLCVVLGGIPLLMAFSRVYLGVHYISDVLAGLCLGLICVLTLCRIYSI